MISPARAAAFDILLLVDKGGYAADLLHSRTERLDARDAGLAAEIVLGSLRFRPQLDFLVGVFSGRKTRLDPEVLTALRMGIYQLRYLDRVPAHAAVAESVELVKRARKASAAGLVNAVLRKVNRADVPWPDRETALCHSAWMLDSWERQFGRDAAEEIAAANLQTPETYVRIPPGTPPPDGIPLEPTGVAGCFRVLRPDRAAAQPAAPFRIQDIGAQAIIPLLDLRPGQSFLDLCAAPGNKTAQALEHGVHTVACEIHFSRALTLKVLGCPVVVADGRQPLPFRRPFDRILVDAPCSGTGTLSRNPEIKHRLHPEHLRELQAGQTRLLENALQLLAPGGRLVYSTCSLEREENEDVIARVTAGPAAVAKRVDRIWRRLPGRDPGDGFFAAVLTSD